jgi:hypothetical protein
MVAASTLVSTVVLAAAGFIPYPECCPPYPNTARSTLNAFTRMGVY